MNKRASYDISENERRKAEFLEDLYWRLPDVKNQLVEVDGSVYWMLSYPKEAADVIGEWFNETLPR
jgi:hypothetical protein